MKREIHLIKREIQKMQEMSKEEVVRLSLAGGFKSVLAINLLASHGYKQDGTFVGIATATNAMPTGYIKTFNKYLQILRETNEYSKTYRDILETIQVK